MEVDCEGCAGCCVDWRDLAPEARLDYERRGRFRPLDDVYTLVPLTSDEVRAFLRSGLGDAMTPRLFAADEGAEAAEVGGLQSRLGVSRLPTRPVARRERSPGLRTASA